MSQLKQGNRQFRKGNYEKALKLYDDALIDRPYSPVLHFNAGAAAYQAGDLERADKEFKESAQAGIPVLRSASHYNHGNTYFRQGKWDEAIEAYKDALRANPGDEDAKYNLGVAIRAKKNPPQQCPNPKPGSQKDKEKGGGTGDKKEDGSAQAQGAKEKQQMSREDAERVLSAAAAGERKKQNERAPQAGKNNEEDW